MEPKLAPGKLKAQLVERLKVQTAKVLAKAAETGLLADTLSKHASPVDQHQHVEIDPTPNQFALGDPRALELLKGRKRAHSASARPSSAPSSWVSPASHQAEEVPSQEPTSSRLPIAGSGPAAKKPNGSGGTAHQPVKGRGHRLR